MNARPSGLPPVILLAEDDDGLRSMLTGLLRRNFPGHDIHALENGLAADAEVKRLIAQGRGIAMVVSDLVMPEMDGLELLERCADHNPDIVRVILTGQGALDSAIQSLRMGVDDYVQKPFNEPELVRTLTRHLDNNALRRVNADLRKRLTFTSRYVGLLVEAVLVRFDRYLEDVLDLPQVSSEQRRRAFRARRALDLVARAYNVPEDGAESTFEVVPLMDIVDGAVRSTLSGRELEESPFTIRAPTPAPTLHTDASAARIALTQLLDNALFEGPGRATVMLLGGGRNWPEGVLAEDLPVAVRQKLTQGHIGVSVTNTAALTRDDESYIRRVLSGEVQEGDKFRGLGLPLAQLYSAVLGGELVLSWQPKRSEITFTLLLPGGTA